VLSLPVNVRFKLSDILFLQPLRNNELVDAALMVPFPVLNGIHRFVAVSISLIVSLKMPTPANCVPDEL
jgi:hypothetical protein